MGFGGGTNRYLYGLASPHVFIDPLGLSSTPWPGIFGEAPSAFTARVFGNPEGPGRLAMHAERGVFKVAGVGVAGGVVMAASAGLGGLASTAAFGTGELTGWAAAGSTALNAGVGGGVGGAGFQAIDDSIAGKMSSGWTYTRAIATGVLLAEAAVALGVVGSVVTGRNDRLGAAALAEGSAQAGSGVVPKAGGVFRMPRSVGSARHPVYDRLEAAMARHGGVLAEGGVRFPSRRVARQAASEVAGDMGSSPRAIRAREFRGGPRGWKDSDMVIGRESADRCVLWRDDVLGHPRFDMGPHVNVEVDGINLHLFY
jgi:hypothetical protein